MGQGRVRAEAHGKLQISNRRIQNDNILSNLLLTQPVNPLENIAIVLVRPQYAGNMGSVSRAMKNMGLGRLILVAPEQDLVL